MNRITITAGIGEDRNGQPIAMPTLAEAMATIRGKLAATFGGYTETAATGGWINDEGRLVMEPATRWLILTDDDATAEEEGQAAARMVREALNQASVMLEVEPVAAMFVTGKPVTIGELG